MNQGPKWILLMKKTRAVKSRATVPLRLVGGLGGGGGIGGTFWLFKNK